MPKTSVGSWFYRCLAAVDQGTKLGNWPKAFWAIHREKNVWDCRSRSHQLWLLHRVLMRCRVPWSVTWYVRTRRAHRRFHSCWRVPNRSHRWRTSGKSAAIGQCIRVYCSAALLHQLLELRSLVLKPNFHLKKKKCSLTCILKPSTKPSCRPKWQPYVML